MKNLVMFILVFALAGGAAAGFILYREHESLMLAHAEALERITVLEGSLEEREAQARRMADEAQAAKDGLAERDARLAEQEAKLREVTGHLSELSARYLELKDTAAGCERARLELAKAKAERERAAPQAPPAPPAEAPRVGPSVGPDSGPSAGPSAGPVGPAGEQVVGQPADQTR